MLDALQKYPGVAVFSALMFIPKLIKVGQGWFFVYLTMSLQQQRLRDDEWYDDEFQSMWEKAIVLNNNR
jgi:hypothetical protein